ncbi:MAG: hypothetical protein JWO73_5 [Candidatus Taylorbacteria bacterium]|nr:hypothetical protein [Candidatus Taylorbacteria bacterium]
MPKAAPLGAEEKRKAAEIVLKEGMEFDFHRKHFEIVRLTIGAADVWKVRTYVGRPIKATFVNLKGSVIRECLHFKEMQAHWRKQARDKKMKEVQLRPGSLKGFQRYRQQLIAQRAARLQAAA